MLVSRAEAAGSLPSARIAEGAEEHVPQRQIGEVIPVYSLLMMDAVTLGSLKQKTEPVWGADVPVIYELGEAAHQYCAGCCGGPDAHSEIEDDTREQAVC